MELVILVVGAVLGVLWARLTAMQQPSTPAQPVADAADSQAQSPEENSPEPEQAGPAETETSPVPADPRARVQELAKDLEDKCEEADRGADLLPDPRFIELTELLTQPPFTAEERSQWISSQTTALSCASLAAMARLRDPGHEGVARTTPRMGYMALHFAFAYLAEVADPEAAGLLLLRSREWWTENPGTRAALIGWLNRQQQLQVQPVLPATADGDWELDERRNVLRLISHPVIDDFLRMLEREDAARRGQIELARVGRTLAATDPLPVAEIARTEASITALIEVLARENRPSGVLVGASGAGKTTLAHGALRRLIEQGWRVIEATPAQLMAGQKYIGEIEQRIENLALGLSGQRTIWFVPDCHSLLETGSWSGNPRGLLDLLLPHLERGSLQLLGESTPAAWARVLTQRPRVEALIQTIRVDPLDDADALALAQDWGERWAAQLGTPVLSPAMATEARELARQQFPDRAEPGRTLELLKEALAAALRADPPTLPLDRDQLLAALARSSGLPIEILDVGRPLDVAKVRADFSAAVIGQNEAVDCLVDRISMLKAGLTDTRRPIGVFLFAGPTGTGKTELAKTLARYLFGASERLLRIDMSEYQSDDAYWRLIDDGGQGRSQSLTTRIRQNPFSVVLLDEFEKAHPRVWDLFLQVFDDGRLTDRSGNTADFRHSIIVLTSNLGSTISKGGGIGFIADRGGFNRELVERAIGQTFRPEFINRLDRVVIFNPLTRALMRDILQKELLTVLGRRGFRSRDWAVEWEPSAIEFLLDKGFTPDLGARPLRRAIDQYLLSPLARTMVEHRVPAGEQFLFVHGDGDALRVRFVDPDAADSGAVATGAGTSGDLRAIALDPRADAQALSRLQSELDQADRLLLAPQWQALKESAAQAMQARDFWYRDERQEVLDRLERVDRIEAGLRSARSLLARLERGGGRTSGELLRRLALLVLGLQAAIDAVRQQQPEDARLEIRPAEPRSEACLTWRDRLLNMYALWAKARGLRVSPAPGEDGTVCLLISGYAAFQRLQPENGLHVLDVRGDQDDLRCSARVRVSSDPPLATASDQDSDSRVCRRYEDGPAPLVRDHVRGWRSGRLDRVLCGDFDLIGDER
ncbi:MAG: AAA family ATPase [Lysobacterales bacterium]